jgi:hypothetical protein
VSAALFVRGQWRVKDGIDGRPVASNGRRRIWAFIVGGNVVVDASNPRDSHSVPIPVVKALMDAHDRWLADDHRP